MKRAETPDNEHITCFADRFQALIEKKNSFLLGGIDPRPELFPKFIFQNARELASSDDDFVYHSLVEFSSLAIESAGEHLVAVKPNFAFFFRYGLSGIRAFAKTCQIAKHHSLLVIVDAKVSDIGSTAEAYAAAYLGGATLDSVCVNPFEVDALTVNPFLGFDTLEPFLRYAASGGKGLFILVRTSNSGAGDIQDCRHHKGSTVSEHIAEWLANEAPRLSGKQGLSGLGAVVGATHPEEAQKLRHLMPNNIFLIPGFGAQGGSADDAVQGFTKEGNGALVNSSRALFSSLSSPLLTRQEAMQEIQEKASSFKKMILESVEKHVHAS